MSMNKAIEHGKEHRRPYSTPKSLDKTCRNHGSCPHCKNNRMYNSIKTDLHSRQDIDDTIYEEITSLREDI